MSGMAVVYFDQGLGAVHSNHQSNMLFNVYSVKKLKKLEKKEIWCKI